jgi:Tfp pilus assembly protein PilF
VANHRLPESQRARELIERIQADAHDEQAHYLLGQEYLAEGANLEAAAEFRRCVELNPEYAAAWRGLADAYRAAGVEKEARAAEGHLRVVEKAGNWL